MSAAVPFDRLLHGRAVIGVLGAALLGLVFLQVSLLKLNSAISINVERAAKLERGNAQSRATISRLDAGRRVQYAAGQLGMVMPAAGAICFLDARRARPCSGGDAGEAGQGTDPAAASGQAVAVAAQGASSPVAATPVAAPDTAVPAGTAVPPAASVAPQQTPAPAAVQPQPSPAPAPQTAPPPAPATGGLSASAGPGG